MLPDPARAPQSSDGDGIMERLRETEVGHQEVYGRSRRCGFGEIGHQEVYGRSSGGAVLVISRFMGGHPEVRFWSRSVISRFMGGHQEVRFWSRSVKIGLRWSTVSSLSIQWLLKCAVNNSVISIQS